VSNVTASQVIAPQLSSDEGLLWSGQPGKGVVLRGSDVFMIPFSLMWGSFAIFFEVGVLRSPGDRGGGAPFFFSIWGIPFVLIGLYLIAGRFLYESIRRGNTYYGVTTRRILIVTGMFGARSLDRWNVLALLCGLRRRSVKSLDLRTLTDVSMDEKSDASGTISFGPRPYGAWFQAAAFPGMGLLPPSFDLIDKVKSVYEVINRAQRTA
jgi:hypothetical protein